MAMTNNLYSQFQRNRINIAADDNKAGADTSRTQALNKTNGYQQYQNNMVNTASPQELTLMLYNGLVKFLNISVAAIEEKSIEKANNGITKAQDIIAEFMSTLDMSYEVSQGLMSLYDYMNNRLVEANIKKDKAIVEEVLGYAEELRDAWTQAMKLAKQQEVNK